ncbi:oligosaccharide flippase family protein [Ilumatobacter coccineus]|nr:oligosaccharide flippase family protein [Ilumatobacter coccineus]
MARNAAALMASQSVTWVLATVVAAIVPRFLGPVPIGRLSLGVAIWLMVSVLASLGTPTMLTVEVARDVPAARVLAARAIRARAVAFVAVAPFVVLLLLVADYERRTVAIVLAMSFAAFVNLVSSTYASVIHGLQEMGATARVEVIGKLLNAVAVVSALALGGGALAIVGVGAGVSVVSAVLLVNAFRRVCPPATSTSDWSARRVATVAAPFLLAEASLVVYQQLDTLVMSILVDEETIGWYATADLLFGSLLFVPVILMTAMFPAIADMHQRDPAEVPHLLERSSRSLLVVSVPIGVGTIVVSRSFVNTLYGDAYDNAAPVLAVFGVVVILSCQTIMLGRFALATDRVAFWVRLMVFSILLTVPLDLVFVPWTRDRFDNGALGGALAYVVTESIMMIVGVVRMAPHLLTMRTLDRVLRCGAAGGLMLWVGWQFRDMVFVIPGTVSVGVYVVAVWLLRVLSEDEIDQLRRLTRVFRSRWPGRHKKAER